MKLICRCNGGQWSNNLRHMDTQLLDVRGGGHYCPVCRFWPWYNPRYENMMYDLRNMNAC